MRVWGYIVLKSKFDDLQAGDRSDRPDMANILTPKKMTIEAWVLANEQISMADENHLPLPLVPRPPSNVFSLF